jgi:hypothetical protein
MMKVYKLVRRTPEGRLVSAHMDLAEFKMEYRPGEWVEAKVGYLFSLRDSENVVVNGTRELWEAEAEGIHPTPYLIPSLWYANKRRVVEFWESMRVSWDFGQLSMDGTVLSKRLRLVRQVDRVLRTREILRWSLNVEGGDGEGVQAGSQDA